MKKREKDEAWVHQNLENAKTQWEKNRNAMYHHIAEVPGTGTGIVHIVPSHTGSRGHAKSPSLLTGEDYFWHKPTSDSNPSRNPLNKRPKTGWITFFGRFFLGAAKF